MSSGPSMNLSQQTKMAPGAQKYPNKPKNGPETTTSGYTTSLHPNVAVSGDSHNFLMQQHHQLIGGMIGNNQQPQPGSQSYVAQYKHHQMSQMSQMTGLASAPKQTSLSQQRRPGNSAS